jgi:hypothetical protein
MSKMAELISALDSTRNRFEERGTSENTTTRVALIQADALAEIARQLTRIADALEKITGEKGIIGIRNVDAY